MCPSKKNRNNFGFVRIYFDAMPNIMHPNVNSSIYHELDSFCQIFVDVVVLGESGSF